MSYRLGVDVGGTFTDVLLVDEDSGATWRAKTASTPAGPVGRRAARHRQGLRRRRHRARRRRPGAARHHRRDQRDPRGQGRHRRPGHHQGLPPGAADRPLLRARRPRRLDHLAQARAAGRAGEHRRGARADRQRRRGDPRARRGRRPRAAAPSSQAQRHRGAGRLPDQLLRQRRRTSSGSPRSPPRCCPASRCRCRRTCCRRCASTSARSPPSPTATSSRRSSATSQTLDGQARASSGVGRRAVDPAQRRRPAPPPASPPTPRSPCCCPARPAASPARSGSPSSAATAT